MYILIDKHEGWEKAAIVTNGNKKIVIFPSYAEANKASKQYKDVIIVGDGMFTKEQVIVKMAKMSLVVQSSYGDTVGDLDFEARQIAKVFDDY